MPGTETPLTISPLTAADDLSSFDCGGPARNTWFKSRAMQNQQSNDTRTYLGYLGRSLAGFYAVSTGSILRRTLSGALRRNAPDPVSTILLAQLAVSIAFQGQGRSCELIRHVMQQTLKTADLEGFRLFTVYPAWTAYYAKLNLTPVEAAPQLMMAMSLQTLRATLAAAQEAAAAKRGTSP